MILSIDEVIEELDYCIGLIKQDGKDYIDDRDIPFLGTAINTMRKYQKIEEIIKETRNTLDKMSCSTEFEKVIEMATAFVKIEQEIIEDANDEGNI